MLVRLSTSARRGAARRRPTVRSERLIAVRSVAEGRVVASRTSATKRHHSADRFYPASSFFVSFEIHRRSISLDHSRRGILSVLPCFRLFVLRPRPRQRVYVRIITSSLSLSFSLSFFPSSTTGFSSLLSLFPSLASPRYDVVVRARRTHAGTQRYTFGRTQSHVRRTHGGARDVEKGFANRGRRRCPPGWSREFFARAGSSDQ